MKLSHLHVKYLLIDAITLCIALGVVLVFAQFIYSTHRSIAFEMGASPGLLPAAGLNDIESFPDRAGRYRWTNGSGVVKLPNPGGPLLVRLLMAAGPGRSVPVTLDIGKSIHFVVGADVRRYAVLLPPGTAARYALNINSPAITEGERQLGVLISDIRISGGGYIPLYILWSLLTATTGIYVVTRCAGVGSPVAGILDLSVISGVLVWQHLEGWRYGITGTLLWLIGCASIAAVALECWLLPRISHDDYNDQTTLHFTLSDWVALGLTLLLALIARLPWLILRDPVGDIELSARQMNLLFYEGLAGAYRFGNDYMPLRLYILRSLSLFSPLLGPILADPLPSYTLVMLKLPGIFADLATISLIYVWSRRWQKPLGATIIALIYALAPPVWINVAWWGQVDAWLMLALLSTVLLLDWAGGRWSWVCWATALLIKPQAIIILPLLYAATVRRYGCRGFAQGAVLAGVVFLLGCLPLASVQGSADGIVQAYVGSVERFPLLTNRAFNIWYLVTLGHNSFDVGQGIGPISYRTIGLVLTGSAALIVMLSVLQRTDTATRLYGASVLALAFFLLPTQIHERYLFLSLAFLALAAAKSIRLVIPYLLLVTTATINILGTLGGFAPHIYQLIAGSSLPFTAAGCNLAVLLYLLYELIQSIRRNISEKNAPITLTFSDTHPGSIGNEGSRTA